MSVLAAFIVFTLFLVLLVIVHPYFSHRSIISHLNMNLFETTTTT